MKEYEIIERNEYGVLVKNTKEDADCELCKHSKQGLLIILCIEKNGCVDSSYYLPDQEPEKLESELTTETFTINDMYVESKLLFDCQDKLNDLQIENKKLKERIKDLESEKSTELIDSPYSSVICQYMLTKCCNIHVDKDHNFCPNCGRKIMR